VRNKWHDRQLDFHCPTGMPNRRSLRWRRARDRSSVRTAFHPNRPFQDFDACAEIDPIAIARRHGRHRTYQDVDSIRDDESSIMRLADTGGIGRRVGGQSAESNSSGVGRAFSFANIFSAVLLTTLGGRSPASGFSLAGIGDEDQPVGAATFGDTFAVERFEH